MLHTLFIDNKNIGTFDVYFDSDGCYRFLMNDGYSVEVKGSKVKNVSKVFKAKNSTFDYYIELKSFEEYKSDLKKKVLNILENLSDSDKLTFYNSCAYEADESEIHPIDEFDHVLEDKSPSDLFEIIGNSDSFSMEDDYFMFRDDNNDLVSGDLNDLIDYDFWAERIVNSNGFHSFSMPFEIMKLMYGFNYTEKK